MIGRNHVLKVKLIEKSILPTNWWPHHRRNPLSDSATQGNHADPNGSNDFFDSLGY
jgi:hypothetical protein